jgi:hypothetical protein
MNLVRRSIDGDYAVAALVVFGPDLHQSSVEHAVALDGDRFTRVNLAPYTCLEFRLKS